MNQSSVSYWLDQLRRKFDDQLFTRSGAGVVATARAERLMPQARELLSALSKGIQIQLFQGFFIRAFAVEITRNQLGGTMARTAT